MQFLKIWGIFITQQRLVKSALGIRITKTKVGHLTLNIYADETPNPSKNLIINNYYCIFLKLTIRKDKIHLSQKKFQECPSVNAKQIGEVKIKHKLCPCITEQMWIILVTMQGQQS